MLEGKQTAQAQEHGRGGGDEAAKDTSLEAFLYSTKRVRPEF